MQIKIKAFANVMKITVSDLLVKHTQSNESCDIVNKQQATCIQSFLVILRSQIYENWCRWRNMIISLDLELFKLRLLAEAQVEIECSSDGIV